jgi:hypothetical protein
MELTKQKSRMGFTKRQQKFDEKVDRNHPRHPAWEDNLLEKYSIDSLVPPSTIQNKQRRESNNNTGQKLTTEEACYLPEG